MSDEMRDALSSLLPLRLEEVDYNDPMVVISGPEWSLSIACPWRLMRDKRLLTSYGDDGAAEVLLELVGMDVVALGPVNQDHALGDMRVALANGTALHVFVDTDLDPWVLRLRDHTFVGAASSAR